MNEQIKLIALRISDMREIRGISQTDMAAKMDLSLDEYLSYEKGEQDFSFTFLYKASNILGIEMAELLTGEHPQAGFLFGCKGGTGLKI